MDRHKLLEEIRAKAKKSSIPFYPKDEESYLMSELAPEEWLEQHSEYLTERRKKELEGRSNKAEEDYKKSFSLLTGTNIDEIKMPKLEAVEVPDDIDWEQTFKAISGKSIEEWHMATSKLEREESSEESQDKVEKEWQLAEED